MTISLPFPRQRLPTLAPDIGSSAVKVVQLCASGSSYARRQTRSQAFGDIALGTILLAALTGRI